MRKNILFITSCLLAATTFAEDINTLPKDTTKVIDIGTNNGSLYMI